MSGEPTQCTTGALQLSVASAIVKQDGVGALYKGLSAGLLRQATYTTARLGIYQLLSDGLVKYNGGQACSFLLFFLYSLFLLVRFRLQPGICQLLSDGLV